MMPTTATGTIGWLLANLADIVDLPPDMYQAADEQYRLVGQFLANRSDEDEWDVYPQGSIRLGTVVRPFTGYEGFDLDMALGTSDNQRRFDDPAALLEGRFGAKRWSQRI
jgi:hypothetical protein